MRRTLAGIKRNGYHLTRGENNPGVAGIAAPILTHERGAVGSIGVAWDEEARRDVDVQSTVLAIKQTARTVSERLAVTQSGSAPECGQG
ncbi:IclR family transcriptional regulator C-terminal domain-containing protein [Arthrobacter sp. NPDC093139]|uniref:IclR family transcriptional regulator domain-containing protein n=1 Tax=Arthrobacter sp. NPDC093139 TaxID=3363945 RepID=UPI00382870D5